MLRPPRRPPLALLLPSHRVTSTTATNRWLATTLNKGNLHKVSRKVSAWQRQPDDKLNKKLA